MNEKTPGGLDSSGCSYKAFMNTTPSDFNGVSDPIVVTKWLSEMDHIFRICQCTEVQKVLYATTMLKGEALHWWDVLTITLGDEVVKRMTWDQFKKNIQDKYCLQSRIDCMEEETVKEHTAKFIKKDKFACPRGIKRYIIRGLKMGIRGQVNMTNSTSFQKIEKAASKVEIEFNRQYEELKRKWDKSSKFKKAPVGLFKGEGARKLKTCERSQKKKHKGECRIKCYECRTPGHLANACPSKEKVCFYCQSQGHLANACPSKEKVCFSCQSQGHLANACPSKEKVCFNCQSQGHLANACPSKEKVCFSHQSPGHLANVCPSKEKVCFSCQSPRHLANVCPYKEKVCFSCGSPGHMVVNCLKKAYEVGSSQKEGKSYELAKRKFEALEVKRGTYKMTLEDAQTSQNVVSGNVQVGDRGKEKAEA